MANAAIGKMHVADVPNNTANMPRRSIHGTAAIMANGVNNTAATNALLPFH